MKKIISFLAAAALVFGTGAALPEGAVLFGEQIEASAEASGTFGDGLVWKLDNSGTLTISGNGSMGVLDYGIDETNGAIRLKDNRPWGDKRTEITKIVIEEGVTDVGDYFFGSMYMYPFVFPTVKTVELPSTIRSIGKFAFSYCTQLEQISIPEGVTEISQAAFLGCEKITDIKLPSTLKTIGESAFGGLGIKSINIPDGVSILDNAFSSTPLESVVIPDSVTELGDAVFSNCKSLKSVTLPKSIKAIPNRFFANCIMLESIIIPDKVTKIGDSAFSGCESLKTINIPKGATDVDFQEIFDNYSDNSGYRLARLEAVEVDPDNPIYRSVDGVVYDKELTQVIYCPVERKELVLPDSITSIDRNAFSKYNKLESLTLPKDFDDYRNLTPLEEIKGLTVYYYNDCIKENVDEYVVEHEYRLVKIYPLGDADNDGKVSVDDVLLIQQKIAGWDVKIDMAAADLDGDGKLSVSDALIVQQIIAGWKISV